MANISKRKFEIDMCNGTIMDKLISFALPLCISSILQLMFNAVDIIVVGQFSGKEALAAVGATTSLINLVTNLFMGISIGANVLTARYKASGEKQKLSNTVHTSMTFALISGLILIFVGMLVARPALEIMETPLDIIDKSELYMKIYFCGIPFVLMYNYGAAILRAVGDTKRPLIFLIISGFINAGLNVLLVAVFNLSVAGVAIATITSQFISCVLVVICLFKDDSDYRLYFKKLGIKKRELFQILKIGVPAGIQSTVISISNSMLQSSVNSFDNTSVVAGYAAANNIFGFMYVIVNSISQACMSFTSQNYGACKPKRMDGVLRNCIILQLIVPTIVGTLVYIFGPFLIGIYNNDAEVIKFGVEIQKYTTITYFICGMMDLFPSVLRGLGNSTIPMILSIVGTVGTRIIWIYLVFPHFRDLSFLFISYPLSWGVTMLMQIVCYIFVRRSIYGRMYASKTITE